MAYGSGLLRIALSSLKKLMWEDWIMRRIINSRTYGFNEEERTRYLARLDELMKITQGWREPVGAKPPRGTTNEVQEVEVDI